MLPSTEGWVTSLQPTSVVCLSITGKFVPLRSQVSCHTPDVGFSSLLVPPENLVFGTRCELLTTPRDLLTHPRPHTPVGVVSTPLPLPLKGLVLTPQRHDPLPTSLWVSPLCPSRSSRPRPWGDVLHLSRTTTHIDSLPSVREKPRATPRDSPSLPSNVRT